MNSVALSTEEEVLSKLAQDAVSGHLLLFIGTGFSKSVLPPSPWNLKPAVPSWTDLLRELCKRMELEPNDYILPGNSKIVKSFSGENPSEWLDLPHIDYACPAIATRMCNDWEAHHADAGKTGSSFIKELIAGLSVWVPQNDMRERVRKILEEINPIGIVTTNYDMVLEAILAEKGQYLPRNEVFRSRNDEKIPIWHVHGSIQDPPSIVVTSEDYQQFFRPNDYVQRKISMLLREYTTLFIGYSMSDPNIATAVDWAMHVFKPSATPTDDVVQIRLVQGQDKSAIRQDQTTQSLYYINVEDAVSFLEKLKANVSLEKEKSRQDIETFSKLTNLFNQLSERQNVVKAKGDGKFEAIVEKIKYAARKENNPDLILKLMPYVQSCIANAKARANMNNNFQAYADWLFILLVTLRDFSIKEMPPALFALLGEELDAVLSQTGNEFGKSYSANELWRNESRKIPKDVLQSFLEYAERLQLRNLSTKLKSVLNPVVEH